MKSKNRNRFKSDSYWFFLFVLILSTVLRCVLVLYPKRASIYYDELIMQELAQNICRSGTMTVYHVLLNFSKILYPVVLSPLYLIQDTGLRMSAISVFNAVLISSALIPGYLLAKKLLKTPWKINTALLILACSPYMGFSTVSMAENLYYPLFLWCFYLAVSGFEKKTFFNRILTGFVCFLLYLTKESGIAFFAALLLPALADLITKVGKRQENGILVLGLGGGFLIPYLITRFTLFGGQGYTYGYQVFLNNPGTSAVVLFILMAVMIFLAYFLLSWLFIPILLPILGYNRLPETEKKIILITGIYIFCTAFGIAFGISVSESFPNLTQLRIHLRYFIAAAYPILLLFLSEIGKKESVLQSRGTVAVILLTTVFSALLIGFPFTGSTVDIPPLHWLTELTADADKPVIWLMCIPALVLIPFLILRPNGRSVYLKALPVLIIGLELFSSATFYSDLKQEQQVTDEGLIAEIKILDQALDGLEDESLLISNDPFDPKLMAMNTWTNDNYYTISSADFQELCRDSYPTYQICTDSTDFPHPVHSFAGQECYRPENIRNVITFDLSLDFDPETCEDITPEGLQTVRVLRMEHAGRIDIHNPLEYEPGTVISFAGENQDTGYYKISGFAAAEPAFTWSNAAESIVAVKPMTDQSADLEAVWTLAMTLGEQSCKIYAGDELVFDGPVSGGEYRFTVPASCWDEHGIIALRFVYSNPQTPGNGDLRLLAAAFQSLILLETE